MQAGFIQVHVVRGNRILLRVGLMLVIGGLVVSLLFWHWFPLISGVFGIMMIGMWLGRILNPGRHPVYRQLARYGNPQHVEQDIDQEFAGLPASDELHRGVKWLAQGNMYGLDVVPWQEIAWLHIYSRRSVGIMTRHFVRVWSRDGKQFLSPPNLKGYLKPEQAEEHLRNLSMRAPWAEVGLTPKLEHQWKKQRAEFVKRVDARRVTAGATL